MSDTRFACFTTAQLRELVKTTTKDEIFLAASAELTRRLKSQRDFAR